jgi:cell division transport system permease protein
MFTWLRHFAYAVRKAFDSIRHSFGVSVLTSATIGAALVVAGAYLMALENVEALALTWGRAAAITVYFRDNARIESWSKAISELGRAEGVETATLVSPQQAMARFRSRGPEAAALVEEVEDDLLPTSVQVTLRSGFTDLAAVEKIAALARKLPDVASVDYGQEEFSRLRSLLGVLRLGGLCAGLLIAVAIAFIIANTIRLTVYARREEIAILQLVGASRWFVRAPFLVEGFVWGATGGGLGVLLLWGLDRAVAPRLTQALADVLGGLGVRFFDGHVGVLLFAAGVSLGVLGSLAAVGRLLDIEVT